MEIRMLCITGRAGRYRKQMAFSESLSSITFDMIKFISGGGKMIVIDADELSMALENTSYELEYCLEV
jgi:hypothetical protein